jgi:flagellar motility protein MotE (MotC chaperone)
MNKFTRHQTAFTGPAMRAHEAQIVSVHDFKEAVTCLDAKGEFITTADNLRTLDEQDAAVKQIEAERAQARRDLACKKLEKVVSLYKTGLKDSKQIALSLGMAQIAVISKLRAARKYGLIE